MDLSYGAEYEQLRSEVRDFLAQSWPLKDDEAQLDRAEQMVLFRTRAIERGLGLPRAAAAKRSSNPK